MTIRRTKLITNIASKIIRRLASKQHMVLPGFFSMMKVDPDRPVKRKNMPSQKIFISLGRTFKDVFIEKLPTVGIMLVSYTF